MTKKEMEEIFSIKKEIMEIESMLEAPEKTVVVFFKDYRSGIGVPRSLTEVVDGDEDTKTQLEAMLEEEILKLQNRVIEAERFIETVSNSEMRMILRMYYLQDLGEKEIGKRLHRSRSRVSQLITGFWKKQ